MFCKNLYEFTKIWCLTHVLCYVFQNKIFELQSENRIETLEEKLKLAETELECEQQRYMLCDLRVQELESKGTIQILNLFLNKNFNIITTQQNQVCPYGTVSQITYVHHFLTRKWSEMEFKAA